MVKLAVLYEGDLHTLITHLPSGGEVHTDAPKDNKGRGENFSPTDLLAASLASCAATLIAAYGERKGWDLRGMKIEIEKVMSHDSPRRVQSLTMEAWIPLSSLSEEEQKAVERVARSCPVEKSLHPDIEVALKLHWG